MEVSVSADIVTSFNTTSLTCERLAAGANVASLGACASISSAVAGQIQGSTTIPICPANGRTPETIPAGTTACITYDDQGTNNFLPTGQTSWSSCTNTCSVPVADDVNGRCLYKCSRRALEEAMEESARGRHLSSQQVTSKTAHNIVVGSTLSGANLQTAANTATSTVATHVGYVQSYFQNPAAAVPTGLNLPAPVGTTAAMTVAEVASASGTSTAIFAETSNGVTLGTSVSNTNVGSVTTATPSAGGGSGAATSGAAATHVMGSLALMAAGVLFF